MSDNVVKGQFEYVKPDIHRLTTDLLNVIYDQNSELNTVEIVGVLELVKLSILRD